MTDKTLHQKCYPIGRNGGILWGRDSEKWKETMQIKSLISESESKFWASIMGYCTMHFRSKSCKTGRYE